MKDASSTDSDQTATEADLARRLRKGDPSAIDEMYRVYVDRIYSLVYNQVGRDEAAAQDIVQETFLAALHSAKSFRGRSKVYTWLCSIAYHKVFDFYRRQAREQRRNNPSVDIDSVASSDNLGAPIGGSQSATDAADNRSLIESAMSTLPHDYRQVLMLKYVEEMSVLEMSRIMKRSQKSIEGLLSRARKALQDNMSQIDKG